MKPTEYEQHDGLGLAELVRRKEVTPGEVLEAALALAGERNPALNAIVSESREQARAAVAAGLPEGPFRGVPYLLKDLGALLAGAVTSYGSRLFEGFVADHDSEITARLKRLFVQHTVGARATGAWNDQSRRLTAEWQRAHRLPVTGEADDATLSAMLGASVRTKRLGALIRS